MKLVISSVALVASLVAAQAASAGGFTPTVVEPVVETTAVVPVTPATGEWQGAYGGITLGYGFNGDDKVGLSQDDTVLFDDLGTLEIKGVNAGLRVGYRWQRNKWVVGPELSVEGGDVKDDISLLDTGIDVESKLRHQVALKVKTGYEVRPNTLAYGILGVTRGSFEYNLESATDSLDTDYEANGYVFGLGVERKVTDRMSVTGEIEHNAYKRERIEFNNGYSTAATPEFTNVKLGLNFKF